MKSNKITITTILVLAVAIALGIIVWAQGKNGSSQETAESAPLAAFAQCVADSGLTMYGAEWCSHCKNEKARFGKAFSYIPYVECPQNAKLCLDKGVEGYPTWIDAEGTLYAGEQGLERIAEISGCELPAEFK